MKLIILALIALQTTGCHNTQTNATAQSTDHMQVAVKSKIDTSLRILTYGMPISGPSAMANRDVAKKFGFSYYPVAGCVVTEQLLDSVKRENDRIYQMISMNYGTQWRESFETQVLELSKQYDKAMMLAQKNAVVISKTKELEKQEEYFSLDVKSGSSEDIIDVEAYSFRWSNEKNEKVVHLKLSVDLNNATVKIVDDVKRVYEL